MRNLLGIDKMSRTPITLHEPPRAGDIDGVPTVTKTIVLKTYTRLISSRLAVALDHHAVETGVAAESLEEDVVRLGTMFYAAQKTHRRIAPEVLVELHRVQVLHRNPPEDRASLLNIRATLAHQLAHQVCEGFLIFLCHLKFKLIYVNYTVFLAKL